MNRILVVESHSTPDGVSIITSSGRSVLSNNPAELLSFVAMLKSDNQFIITWDLTSFLAPLFKLLPTEVTALLNSGERSIWPPFRLFYAVGKGKFFGINYKERAHIKDNLYNEAKFDINIYELKSFFPKENSPKSIETVALLGMRLLQTLENMGMKPTKLTSVAAIYEETMLRRMPIPNIYSLPESSIPMLEWCWNYIREWRSAYQIGIWPEGKAFDYDLSCYSEDTEALTTKGWKFIKDLSVGEQILGFNKETNKCSFQPITTMNISSYQGLMYKFSATKIDLLITPNHRVLFKNHVRSVNSKAYQLVGHHHYGEWETRDAKDVPNGNIILPVSFPINDRSDYNVSDEILQIMAWIITEGNSTCHKNKINGLCISQSESSKDNLAYCNEINNILEHSALSFSHNIRQRPYKHEYPLIKDRIFSEKRVIQKHHHFRIKTCSINAIPLESDIHVIPLWILQCCSLRQLKLFYDTLLKGDGSRHLNIDGVADKISFYTKSELNKDRFQYLCHLLGFKVNYVKPNKSHATYQIHITESNGNKGHNDNYINLNYGIGGISTEQYNGIVSCPTIDDGYLVVRRNGKSCICGNSAYPSELAQLPNISKAEFIHTNGDIPRDSTWGILKGIVDVKADVSPLVSTDGVCRAGRYPDFLPVEEWECIKRWGIGDFIPQEGWFIRVPLLESSYGRKPSLPYLFAYPMQRLYDFRNGGDTLKNDIAKSASVSVWGKFQEMHGEKYGDFWNSIYACMVASRVRIRDCDFIYENRLLDDLISVTVDGCIASRLLSVPTSKSFGQWRLNPPSPVMVLTASHQWVGDKRPNGKNVYQMIEEVSDHPAAKHFGGIHLTMLEYDRFYDRLPKNGRDLLKTTYRSKPFTATDGAIKNTVPSH